MTRGKLRRLAGTLLIAGAPVMVAGDAQAFFWMFQQRGPAYYQAPHTYPQRLRPAPYGYVYEAPPPQQRVKRAKPARRTAAQTAKHGSTSPYRRQIVPNPTHEQPGTVVVDTKNKFLYLVLDSGDAIRYGVAVGKQGFEWSGVAKIGAKAEWPGWRPPPEMRRRNPRLPVYMPGGPRNPLGARALYLFQNGRDTLFRIHGTNEPSSIGRAASSGCVRMLNEDVMDLYSRLSTGTRVVVTDNISVPSGTVVAAKPGQSATR